MTPQTTCPRCGAAGCRGCPSPEEIAERAAEIREGWSEDEHRRRAGRPREDEWTPPVVGDPGFRDDGSYREWGA